MDMVNLMDIYGYQMDNIMDKPFYWINKSTYDILQEKVHVFAGQITYN